MATPWQIRKIHSIKGASGMKDADYRAMLERDFGTDSSKKLTVDQATAFIAALQKATNNSGRRPSQTMAGPFAGKLRALWIAGYHLGVFRQRDDRALIAFVQRQTGFSHTRFLTDMADAARAIEALKKIISREAGVEWPDDKDHGAIKQEVIRALVAICAKRRCRDADALLADAVAQLFETAKAPEHFNDYSLTDLDALTAHLGKFLKVGGNVPMGRKRVAA